MSRGFDCVDHAETAQSKGLFADLKPTETAAKDLSMCPNILLSDAYEQVDNVTSGTAAHTEAPPDSQMVAFSGNTFARAGL
jgi:hypothetical protein